MELCSPRLSSFEKQCTLPEITHSSPIYIYSLPSVTAIDDCVFASTYMYKYNCGKTTRAQQKYGFGAVRIFFSLLWRYYLRVLTTSHLISGFWVSVQIQFEQKPGVSSIGGRIECRQLLITEWTGADSTWFVCFFFFIFFISFVFFLLLLVFSSLASNMCRHCYVMNG